MTPAFGSIEIVFVVAIARNGVIGRDNAMPWRLKSDLRHFKAMTIGRPVVMGRKTHLSIGKPLPGRTNIVVTRDKSYGAPGIVVANDLDAALVTARADALRRGVSEIAVIGGGEIFAELMPRADRLEITIVEAEPEGDVLFPPWDRSVWQEVSRRVGDSDPADTAPVTFVTYRREKAATVL
jgi:dihydrofolate reductase